MNPQFDADREAVVAQAVAAGVQTLLITGTDLSSSEQAAEYCRQRSVAHHCYATAGVHPHDAKSVPPDWIHALRAIASQPTVRAVGEMGLDYNRNFSPKQAQLQVFEAQLQLACELQLPAFVHDRDASSDVYQLLKRYMPDLTGVVVHCFTGSEAALLDYLDLGCHIGITGWVCDERRGLALQEIVPSIPLERLLLETDAPFLFPRNAPKQRNRRNAPALLVYVADKVAELRAMSSTDVAAATTANAQRLFNIDAPNLLG